MSQMVTLTEENYREVLKKIQEMTNSYKMLHVRQFTTVESGIRTEDEEYGEPDYKSESWGKRRVYAGEDENGYPIAREEDYRYTCFVHVTEHAYKVYHDKDSESSDGKQWEQFKPLIRLDLSPVYVIMLTYGDKVKFDETGFSVYTDNSNTRFGRDLVVHQNTFIIAHDDKIMDLDFEIAKRDQEWEEDAEDYLSRLADEADDDDDDDYGDDFDDLDLWD